MLIPSLIFNHARCCRSRVVSVLSCKSRRCLYATVSSSIVGQRLHPYDQTQDESSTSVSVLLDSQILKAALCGYKTPLLDIIEQYIDTSGTVLDVSLPYESRPSDTRRPRLTTGADSGRNVVTVAHCARVGPDHKITLSSGFALNVEGRKKGEILIITCAHTLEEVRQSPLLLSESARSSALHQSGTFILVGSGDSMTVHPVPDVVSALPRSDLLLLSCHVPPGTVNTLPVSPYPAHEDASILAHFVSHKRPSESGWHPWVGDTWGKWVKGKVLGYRDFAGREAKPGTYDALSHLLFTPLPTAGSSGGPIIEEESGAVVGMMLGTRMDNRVEGVRGWGVPSESIFEMFTLPGLEKTSKNFFCT